MLIRSSQVYTFTVYLRGSYRVSQGFTVYPRAVQCISEVYSVSQSCTVYLRGLQCIPDLYGVSQRFTVYPRAVQCSPELYSVSQSCTVYLRGLQCIPEVYSVFRDFQWIKNRQPSRGIINVLVVFNFFIMSLNLKMNKLSSFCQTLFPQLKISFYSAYSLQL